MNKAIFLDRDGVINIDKGDYTYKKDDVFWVEDIAKAIVELHRKGYLIIVITNQAGIAKGIYSHQEVNYIHNLITTELTKNCITEIYYCPHHPDYSNCLCRKPNSLLVEKALARFSINPQKSYFIGDKQRDVDAAERANVKGILVPINSSILNWAKSI